MPFKEAMKTAMSFGFTGINSQEPFRDGTKNAD
jgi:hypothetical protein